MATATAAPPRVLIIDDNEADARLLREAFAECGFSPAVAWAPLGPVGLVTLAQSHRPDERLVIVLDLNMPLASGREILQTLRTDHRFRQVPVLIFTTSTIPQDEAACTALGATAYLRKPATFEGYQTVVRVIQELLDIHDEPLALIGDEG